MARTSYKRHRSASAHFGYDRCEPRTMLTVVLDVGDLNSGVAVSDDATGEGYILFSTADVHSRFSGIGADNADHFIATRLDGLQWQYNNDSAWVDFEPTDGDALVAKVNFSGDSVVDPEGRFVQQGIWWHVAGPSVSSGISVVANQFGGQFDKDEFTVLGSTIEINEVAPAETLPSESQLSQLVYALEFHHEKNDQFPGLANFDSDGNALLSWRVHLLPHMGLENLYAQFNLDEAWNSPHNLALADQMPDVYKSLNFDSPNRTTFAAVAGAETRFQLDGTPIDLTNSNEDGAVFVEVDNSRSVVWTSPVDWYYSPANPLSGLGNASEEGFAVALLSGRTATISVDVDQSAFSNLIDTTNESILDYSALGIDPLEPSEAMRELALGILNYESAIQRLPDQAVKADDGTPLLSWRVSILPFLGYNELYQQFNLDEPWDSSHNLGLLSQMPIEFQHLSVGDNKTVFLGLDGDGTVFNSQLVRGLTFGQLTDGTSNTILIVEADASEAVEWTRPVDLSYEAADPLSGLGLQQADGRFLGTLVDASQEFFATDQADEIAAWASAAGGEVNDYNVLDRERGSTWRNLTPTKLRQLMLAALNHESAFMEFPHTIYDTPSGEGSPLLSWRVRILPWIEQGNLYNQFHLDEPWDSPHNLSLLPLMPPIFSSPGLAEGLTVFQGPHGDNTFFSNTNDGSRYQEFPPRDTASILEVAPDHAIEWTRPDDFTYDPTTLRSFFENPETSGFHLALVDGSVHFFDDTQTTELLNKIVSPADFADVDIDTKTYQDLGKIENNLRQIALGIHNYESSFRHFPHHAIYAPQGGEPLLSWRVSVLPFIGHQELFEKFNLDEPWDSEHNLSLLPLMPNFFKHASVENGMTVLQVVSSNWDPNEPPESLFPLTDDVDIGFGNIFDGSSNTVMVVETNLDQAVTWTKPQDIVYDSADPAAGLGLGEDFQGNWIALADGSVRFVPANLLSEQWAAAISPRGGDFPDFYNDDSYQYGTIVPNVTLGTEGDDSVVINVTDDTVELIVNGDSQTFPILQFDPFGFDALGGFDDLTINGPEGVDVTFSNGTIHVGDFSIIAKGFESLEFGSEVTLTVLGSDGDDIFSLLYEDDIVTASLGGSQLGLPPLSAEQVIAVDGGAGTDRLLIQLNLDQNQTSVEESTLTSFEKYEVSWSGVEFVDIDNQQDFQSNFIFFADPDTDRFFVESDQVIIIGPDTTITLARDADDTTGLGSRSNTPMPIEVVGTPQDDTFDFGYNPEGLPLFKFHHLVYFPDSPVTFNGGEGNDTVRINQLETFIQPIDQAEIRPRSITVDNYQPISWTGVENQVAADIRLATIYDSVGDDTLRVNEDSLGLSGNDYSWTLFDVNGAEAFASTGNDSAFVSADANSFSFTLDGANLRYRGDRLAIHGFNDVFATALESGDQTNFSFFNESIVDLLVSDDEVQFSSPTNDNTFTLSAFGSHTLSGDSGDKAKYTMNTTSNGDTESGLGYVDFEGVGDDSVRFNMTGLTEVELIAGTNVGQLTLNGSAEADVLELRDSELEWTLPRFNFLARNYDDTIVRGFAGGPNDAIVTGSFDSLTAADFDIYEFENISMHVQLLNFGSIDLTDAPIAPVVTGRFGDDQFLMDYSSGSGVLTVNGSATTIHTGQDNVVGIDGLGLIDTLTIIAPSDEAARLTDDSFESAIGGVRFSNVEAIVVQGPNDSSLLVVDVYHAFGDEILIDDDSVSVNYVDQTHSVSITGFTQFDIAPTGVVESMNFRDVRTAPEVTASFDSVSFVGNADFGIAAVPTVHLFGTLDSKLSLFDSEQDEHLFIREGFVELSNDSRSIIASEFSEFEVTASSGVDIGTLEASVSELVVESDGFQLGNVKVIGFDTISNFDDAQLPTVRGTIGDDIFKVTYLPASLAFKANGLETQFLTGGFGDFVINGDAGNDTLTIVSPEADLLRLGSDRLVASGGSTIWSQLEEVIVEGKVTDEITIEGSSGNDVLRFSGNTASLTFPSGSKISANTFSRIDVVAGNGNDVAYLAGSSEGSNTFIGNSFLGRLTTPEQTIVANGFDLVAAVSNSGDDLASFVGSDGEEQFYAGPESARLVGGSYTRNASGFNRVIARSEGGSDYANVTDSDGDDSFYSRSGFARMEFGTGQSATILDFQTVRTVSTIGQDAAQFEGSESADRFVASDRFGRLNGGGFSMIAVAFSNVGAIGGGGNDEAFLSDSAGDDFFSGSPNLSFLSGSNFRNAVVNFPSVVALTSDGFDTAIFNGSDSDDQFYGNPNLANLSGEGYFQFGSGFDFVRAFGGGGDDTAVLRDSDEVDAFFGNSELAYLRNDNFHNEVRGFNSVKAVSVAGEDIATFEGSDGNELFHGHRDSSYLEGNGFRNQVNGFAVVNAIGLAGADVANLHDSDEDESFGGRENRAWLQGETYRLQVTDFENVNAFGFRGGTNRFFIDDPDFQWERFGTWDG